MMSNKWRVALALLGPMALVACGSGQDGKNGSDGTNGASGTNGSSTLVVVAEEPPGSDCPAGGKKIESGVDTNQNGTLDPSEVTSTSYVCNGEAGDSGAPGQPGAAGEAGAPGQGSLVVTTHELAGPNCAYGGTRIETGIDANGDGMLETGEVNASQTQYVCAASAAYRELDALPAVATVQSFALTASSDDGSPRLGFMFTDADYQQTLLDAGAITDLGGVYGGPNTYATYQISGTGWQAYEGRPTPQTYAFSELRVVDGASYYSTNYPAFGGLVSVIRNGGAGAYALTPAFTTHKAHSIAVPPGSNTLYALVAQQGDPGLTLSSYPVADFGDLDDDWTDLATLDATSSTVVSPQLLVAGSTLVASYIQGTNHVLRAAASPSTVAAATDFPVIGGCGSATLADVAWDGTYLYVACVDSTYKLTLQRVSLTNLTNVTPVALTTSITGEIDAIDLEATSAGPTIAVRQGTAVRVYAQATDALPAFDAVLSGNFALAATSAGLVLSVCDFAGNHTLRTFVSR
jgi:hypothetical protein